MGSPSYLAWYALPEQDPYHGVYGDVCTTLEAAGPAALLPGALWMHCTMELDTKAVFALLGSDGRVSLIHCLALQAPLWDSVHPQWKRICNPGGCHGSQSIHRGSPTQPVPPHGRIRELHRGSPGCGLGGQPRGSAARPSSHRGGHRDNPHPGLGCLCLPDMSLPSWWPPRHPMGSTHANSGPSLLPSKQMPPRLLNVRVWSTGARLSYKKELGLPTSSNNSW